MAKFNLDDYETVEQRIARFYADHPDARIITHNETTISDRANSTWVVRAEIWIPQYLNKNRDWEDVYLKSTGLAFEVDGTGMANQTSALENCETSAIGRALANAGYSGNKRTTREEMAKVERGQKVVAMFGPERLQQIKTKAEARSVWVEANKLGASKEILGNIQAVGDSLPE